MKNYNRHDYDKPKKLYKEKLTYSSETQIKEEIKTIIYKDYGEITINNLGTLVLTKSGKHPSIFLDNSGYLSFNAQTSINGKRVNHMARIHRIVAEAFIPNPNNYPQVNHIDGNKLNNCITNLEWVSEEQNHKHAKENNLYASLKGEQNGRSKLTESQVLEIRYRYANGETNKQALSKEYNVSWTLIDLIIKNEIWKHI